MRRLVAAILEMREHCRERAVRVLGTLPPFSPILNQLLADLGNENASYGKLSDLIEKDPVIAGNVLRLVNSGLYGRRATINSVRNAVSVLGLNRLRNTVLGLSVSRMWSHVKAADGFSAARLNLHSVATAILADQLAGMTSVFYPEGAFLAGLFHDLGKMLIAVGMPEDYGHIQYRYKSNERTLRECEHDVVGMTHEELSALAASSWNLPEPIHAAILYHHKPEADTLTSNATTLPLSHVLAAANHHVNQTNLSVQEKINEADLCSTVTIDSLGLNERRKEDALQGFDAEFQAISGFFH
jgi:HD-like signal output (HDOD) protein